MRIGGFVQLKCLVKIRVGRCSFTGKTSKFELAATASSYPRLYRYKLELLSLSLSLLRFASRAKQSRDIVKRVARIWGCSSENWGAPLLMSDESYGYRKRSILLENLFFSFFDQYFYGLFVEYFL